MFTMSIYGVPLTPSTARASRSCVLPEPGIRCPWGLMNVDLYNTLPWVSDIFRSIVLALMCGLSQNLEASMDST